MDENSTESEKLKPQRADARRNRELVLAAAKEAFAQEGLSISLDDIAHRAGVGAGTVYRHFPTKDELFRAVIADQLNGLANLAQELAVAADPGGAFYDFFEKVVSESRRNLAICEALLNSTDMEQSLEEASKTLEQEGIKAVGSVVDILLARAQEVGAVRNDLTPVDLNAIIAGAILMEQRLPSASQGLGWKIVVDGLRAMSSVT
jgi:AcrR family transcriptional regulator